MSTTPRTFYGWWVAAAAFATLGIAVGIPYYGGPFFYDYYEKTFGWTRPETTLGFPLAATLTLWIGPLLVHRFQPRVLLVAGTALTGLAFVGFGSMNGSLWAYYAAWFVSTSGYMIAGPICHQVLVANWFRRNRGKAMAFVYIGLAAGGAISAKYVAKPLTEAFGFQTALMGIGGLMLLVWPLAFFVIRNKPADVGQCPDGDATAAEEVRHAPQAFGTLLRQWPFWLLAVGSLCSIGSIGAVNQHMKFVFREQGFTDQAQLNALFADATQAILIASIAGRIVVGTLADRFDKKWVMVATYVLVAVSIPLLFLVTPSSPNQVYVFAILFGFGMGADYMLIPLMAADRFGVNSLARAMGIILPADTIGQAWFPYLVSHVHGTDGSYRTALSLVFALSFTGAIAIMAMPKKR